MERKPDLTYFAAHIVCLAILLSAPASIAQPAVQARIDNDVAAKRPIVVHVVVALCDNENQGIVPVPAALGNGQDPKSNLYWGAMYGVRTHLVRKAGWKHEPSDKPDNDSILQRAIFHTQVQRNGRRVPLYLVADAWDGARMREAIQAFLEMSAGRLDEKIAVEIGAETVELSAGGAGHLVAFVGHNGLMDFTLRTPPPPEADTPARAAMVLACASKGYFIEHFRATGSTPILLTTGLMAPEAYTLDAAVRAWATGSEPGGVVEAAAKAYHEYQRCGMKGARRLFWAEK